MSEMKIRVAHLYPDLLSLYGDRGNVMAIEYRARLRGVDVNIVPICCGEPFRYDDYDMVFIGGGQDFEQTVLLSDIKKGKDVQLKKAVDDGSVILAICGGYQLLGKYYRTFDGKTLDYTGAIDFYTEGGKKRLIGNFAYDTEFGTVYGFENHSGRTFLGDCQPLGKIISGFGNNGKDGTEGAHFKNTFCTYSHGPVLPKNPAFTDKLLTLALKRKYDTFDVLADVNDTAETSARNQVKSLYF